MTDSYYIFHGNGECGTCSAAAGEYTVKPGRPHENCGCEIEYVRGDCQWTVVGSQNVTIHGSGARTWEAGVEVDCPDGHSGSSASISVTIDAGMAGSGAVFDALDDAVSDLAAEICAQCPAPNLS